MTRKTIYSTQGHGHNAMHFEPSLFISHLLSFRLLRVNITITLFSRSSIERLRATKCLILKLIKIVICKFVHNFPCIFILHVHVFRYVLTFYFIFLQFFIWQRITDEGLISKTRRVFFFRFYIDNSINVSVLVSVSSCTTAKLPNW